MFEEGELPLGKTSGEERNARADQDGVDTEVELVHDVVVEKGTGEFAAAHDKKMLFAGHEAEPGDEGCRRIVAEDDGAALAGRK